MLYYLLYKISIYFLDDEDLLIVSENDNYSSLKAYDIVGRGKCR